MKNKERQCEELLAKLEGKEVSAIAKYVRVPIIGRLHRDYSGSGDFLCVIINKETAAKYPFLRKRSYYVSHSTVKAV